MGCVLAPVVSVWCVGSMVKESGDKDSGSFGVCVYVLSVW